MNQNQFKLNKRISVPIGILVIVLFAILAIEALVWQREKLLKEKFEPSKEEIIKKSIEPKETLPVEFPERPAFNPPIPWHDLEVNWAYYESYFENYINTIVDWLNKSQ